MTNKEVIKCIERLLKSPETKIATTKQKQAIDIAVDAMATRLPKVNGEALFYGRTDKKADTVPHLFWGDLLSIKEMFMQVFVMRPLLQKIAIEAIAEIIEMLDPEKAALMAVDMDYKDFPYRHLK